MKSSLSVLSSLYELLNVDSVRNIITGKIYIGTPPDSDELENITINTLTNPNGYVQSGVINLNVYVQQKKGGRPNLERIKEINQAIFPIVENTKGSEDVFFQLLEDKGFFKDSDRDGLYFYNIRLEFQTI